MERVADYIIDRLRQEGVEHIFLITGRGILYLTDAVAKNEKINGISVYHEQGAAYAAMAYAKSTEGMGACLVSTGCGATNAITGVLCAWQDNLPCVFISGQHMLNETTRYTGVPIRTFGSQEADIIEVVKPITKYAAMLTDPKWVAYEMDKAIHLAQTGRKGPVWLDIPLDIQNMRIEPDELERFSAKEQEESNFDIQQVVSELDEAKRPVLFVGGGVSCAQAQEDVKKFVEKNKIPVVFSTSAADTYGTGNKFSIGAVGSLGGSRAGNMAVQNADYILVLGSKLCSQTIGAEADKFAREAKITVVDIDVNEHEKKGANIDRVIIGNVKDFMKVLNAQTLEEKEPEWLEKCLHWKERFAIDREEFVQNLLKEETLDLYYFAHRLSDKIDKDATVITDAGFEELIIPSTVRFKGEQKCLFPAAQGAMGYAIPAIIGAHYAGRENIITVVGDGSAMMNIQELQTISSHKIPVKIFIINNNMYAVIRKRQKDLFRRRTIGNDPSDGVASPDYEKIADSFGISYSRIHTPDELEEKLDGILSANETMICEVMCTPEQKYLHSSYAINSKKRLVKRPIEDLSPFLDRETFMSEMIIEPIEE